MIKSSVIKRSVTRRSALIAALSALLLAAGPAHISSAAQQNAARKKYGPGVSDTEIKIGNLMAYSGPASSYGTIGKALAAYLAMVNDQGGVNGRKVTLISLDDGYSPARAKEGARRLVEREQVLGLFANLGAAPNAAIVDDMTEGRVPHLFIASGATVWGDHRRYPWTMPLQPPYNAFGKVVAQYLAAHRPDAKIGILHQNDDYGRDYVQGLRDGLGEANFARMVVSTQSYETTDPTIDQQIVTLKNSGADVFFDVSLPKFAAQAIRKADEIGWKPLHFLNDVSTSVASTLEPAGLERSVGIISTVWQKDPSDASWKDDAEFKDWLAWMDRYMPGADKTNQYNVYGYIAGQAVVHVLKACGDDLTRENVLRQAEGMKGVRLAMTMPGLLVDTGPADHFPIQQVQPVRFDGRQWVRFGELMRTE